MREVEAGKPAAQAARGYEIHPTQITKCRALLRQYGEHVRSVELRRSARKLKDLTPEQRAAVEALTEGIVNKLLHGPTVALRAAASEPRSLARSRRLVNRLLRVEGRAAQ